MQRAPMTKFASSARRSKAFLQGTRTLDVVLHCPRTWRKVLRERRSLSLVLHGALTPRSRFARSAHSQISFARNAHSEISSLPLLARFRRPVGDGATVVNKATWQPRQGDRAARQGDRTATLEVNSAMCMERARRRGLILFAWSARKAAWPHRGIAHTGVKAPRHLRLPTRRLLSSPFWNTLTRARRLARYDELARTRSASR